MGLVTMFRVQGRHLTVVNMHTNAFPSVSLRNAYPIASVERKRQLLQGFDHASTVAQNDDSQEALVIVGDFNTTPELDEVPAAQFGMRNAWKDSESYVTIPLTEALLQVFAETSSPMCVDYQYNRGLNVVDKQVVQSGWLSDPLPVCVTYEWAH